MFFKFSTGVSPFCLGRPPLKAVSSPGGRLAVRGPSPAAQRQLAAGPGPEASLPCAQSLQWPATCRKNRSNGLWVTITPQGDRRLWSTFPFTWAPFWDHPSFDPQPNLFLSLPSLEFLRSARCEAPPSGRRGARAFACAAAAAPPPSLCGTPTAARRGVSRWQAKLHCSEPRLDVANPKF